LFYFSSFCLVTGGHTQWQKDPIFLSAGDGDTPSKLQASVAGARDWVGGAVAVSGGVEARHGLVLLAKLIRAYMMYVLSPKHVKDYQGTIKKN
jgi:hypothetical protein